MSGTLLADGAPVLVGGQSDLGGAWIWQNGALVDLQPPSGKLLSWASRTPDGALLVVGNGRRALWRDPAGHWTSEATPAGDELWGCVAFSTTDAWAVGDDPRPDTTAAPVLLHRDVQGWSGVALPSAVPANLRLFKVDGHAPNDVVVVGDDGLALHWDGSQWQQEASGTGVKLTTVRALAGGTYLAVGGLETGVVVLRDEAGNWHKLRDAKTGLSGFDTFDRSIWTCGDAGWLEFDSLDGQTSMEVSDSLTNDTLHFVLRLPNGDALAGGGNMGAWPGKMHGTLLEWAVPK